MNILLRSCLIVNETIPPAQDLDTKTSSVMTMTTMGMTTRATLLLLLVLLLQQHADASDNDKKKRGYLRKRRILSYNNQILDGRWKSTKLTRIEKAKMGLFPPPGEQWPADDPALVAQREKEAAEKYGPKKEGTVTVIDTVEEEEKLEEVIEKKEEEAPKTDATDTPKEEEEKPVGNRRNFISYTPSKFESAWTQYIEKYVEVKKICQVITGGKHQKLMMHTLMDFFCTAQLEGTEWCYWHDHNHYVWFNKGNAEEFEIYIDKTPMELEGKEPPAVDPTSRTTDGDWDLVASKFTFLDETTGEMYNEYIEPLVGHLRFPLAECLENNNPLLVDFASHITPPPSLDRVGGRTMMYDIGSKDWSRMEYIVEEWGARNAGFSVLNSYATSGNEVDDEFLTSVPEHHQSKIFRHYMQLVDFPVPDKDKIFLPKQIQQETHADDYVMVKLDRSGNAKLKLGLIEYILHNTPSHYMHVDELFWEINAKGNYVMEPWMDDNLDYDQRSDLSLPDAYKMLQALRHKGIRAHAWIWGK